MVVLLIDPLYSYIIMLCCAILFVTHKKNLNSDQDDKSFEDPKHVRLIFHKNKLMHMTIFPAGRMMQV